MTRYSRTLVMIPSVSCTESCSAKDVKWTKKVGRNQLTMMVVEMESEDPVLIYKTSKSLQVQSVFSVALDCRDSVSQCEPAIRG